MSSPNTTCFNGLFRGCLSRSIVMYIVIQHPARLNMLYCVDKDDNCLELSTLETNLGYSSVSSIAERERPGHSHSLTACVGNVSIQTVEGLAIGLPWRAERNAGGADLCVGGAEHTAGEYCCNDAEPGGQ